MGNPFETGEWMPLILINGKTIKYHKYTVIKADYMIDKSFFHVGFDICIKKARRKIKTIEVHGFPFAHIKKTTFNTQPAHNELEYSNDTHIHLKVIRAERSKSGGYHVTAGVKFSILTHKQQSYVELVDNGFSFHDDGALTHDLVYRHTKSPNLKDIGIKAQ